MKRPATIRKVLYVPGLRTNFFSITTATDLGWKVTFVDTHVNFVSQLGDVTMTGERVGRTLYLLNFQFRRQEKDESDVAFPSSTLPGISTWNRRLAHTKYKTILEIVSTNAVDGLKLAGTTIPSEPCAGSAYGKHQRPRTRATYPGEIIHLDLCGPKERESPNGSRYFVIFIDEKVRWRFIHFLKNKSEAAHCFMDLIHVIRGETGNLVRIFRTDGGGEWAAPPLLLGLLRKEESAR